MARCVRGRLRKEYPRHFEFKLDVGGPMRGAVQEVALVYGFWFRWKDLDAGILASDLSSSEFVWLLL